MTRDERMRSLKRDAALGDCEASEALALEVTRVDAPKLRAIAPAATPADWADRCETYIVESDSPDAFLLQFGAYASVWVCVIGAGYFGDALESAAQYLEDSHPGLFVEPEYCAEMQAIEAKGREEFGATWDPRTDERFCKLAEDAECDLTRTDSGWLASWEWYGSEVDHTAAVASALSRALWADDDDDDSPHNPALEPRMFAGVMWNAYSMGAGDVLSRETYKMLPRLSGYFPISDWEASEVRAAVETWSAAGDPSGVPRNWYVSEEDAALYVCVSPPDDNPIGEDAESYAEQWEQVSSYRLNPEDTDDDDELWVAGALALLESARGFLGKGEKRDASLET